MRIKIIAAVAAGLLAVAGLAAPAGANPGPGQSHECAPGQHSGPTPPGACDRP
jgi:hypothetical protein